jgi:hypothetical protein
MELQQLKERIKDAMTLISQSDVDSISLGIAELETVRPSLQEYVDKNPSDAEGHLEISKTYQIPMYLAMKLDSASQNDRMRLVSLMMGHMGKNNEYAQKAKFHLEEFCNLGSSDTRMIEAARKIISMLDGIINKTQK